MVIYQDLVRGMFVPGDSATRMDQIPVWLKPEKFQQGQAFFKKHLATITFSLHCSMTIIYTIPRLFGPLAYSKNTSTPRRALKRFLQTFVHVSMWQMGNVWKPGSAAATSLGRVREMHRRVRDALNGKASPGESAGERFPDDSEGNTELKPLNLSQYDMAMVQFSFVGHIVLHPQCYGIECTRSEMEGYIHMWRGLGFLLGIADEFNVCSNDSYEDTYALCREIESAVVIPCMLSLPDKGQAMADIYMRGMNSMLSSWFDIQSKEVVHAYYSEFADVRKKKALVWQDTFRLWFMKLVVFLVRTLPGLEWLLNQYALTVFWYNREIIAKSGI